MGLRMTGIHELSPESGGTRNTLGLEAGGILAVLLWPLLRPAIRRALTEENRGLKARCEQERRPLRKDSVANRVVYPRHTGEAGDH